MAHDVNFSCMIMSSNWMAAWASSTASSADVILSLLLLLVLQLLFVQLHQ
jgi:hypothetical protein